MSTDDIEATKAPLIEHLAELRSRLMKAMTALILATIVCYVFHNEIYAILAQPLINVNPNAVMQTTSPQEAFFTYINLALWGGFFLSFPYIAIQLWGFVGPGLYQHEKKAFLPFLAATPFLFTAGACLAYFAVIPLALDWLISLAEQNATEGQIRIENVNKVSEYLSFIKTLLIAFGVSFQLPVLLTLLGKIGVLTSQQLADGRKYAVVGIAFVAMILTPPDPMSQIALGIPVYLLYEISIHIIRIFERQERERRAKLGLD